MIDTPISELGLAGAAVGAALTGMRPVLEIQFSDFVTLAMEQIVNQAAKIRFMFGGKASVPMVVRLPGGSGTGAAAQHSQSLEAWFAHVPGLKVVQPSTPHDAKGLLLAAIDDPNPVLDLRAQAALQDQGAGAVGAVSRADRRGGRAPRRARRHHRRRVDHGAARAGRGGAPRAGRHRRRSHRPALAASDRFRDDRAERAQDRHGSLIVYEGVKTMGIGAEIAAQVAESEVFHALEAPIVRLGGADSPIPYNPVLEKATVPQEDDIVAAARGLVGARSALMAAIEVVLPKVDMDMESGVIAAWKVAEGDLRQRGRHPVRDGNGQGDDGSRSAGHGRDPRSCARHRRAGSGGHDRRVDRPHSNLTA